MPQVLHIIEYLDQGGGTRAALTTAKWSSKLNTYEHRIVALKSADAHALALAKKAGVPVTVAPDQNELSRLIEIADIVQVEYWNAPAINAFLHKDWPASRLAIWCHIAGNTSPHMITPALGTVASTLIACTPTTYHEHPVFQQLRANQNATKAGLAIAPANFDRVKNAQPKAHRGFNVGYIGTVDFVKMHPNFVPMSASIEVPNINFIVCGNGIQEQLQQQAAAMGAADRFSFRGFVEDIASVISTLDVYGYPLCEDTYAAAELNLQEVMYAGIPPVVFPYGGVKGLIQHNKTGLIVHSEEDYKRAIEYLYFNPTERKRLGYNASQYARQRFGPENAARSMNQIYERLLQQPKLKHLWPSEKVAQSSSLPEMKEAAAMMTLVPGHRQASEATAAQVFAASLGSYGEALLVSLDGRDIQAVLKAEQEISRMSSQTFNGGLRRYAINTPDDPYLHLWAGLYFEQHKQYGPAITEYATALQKGLEEWRIQWYVAKTLRKSGKDEEARRLYEALRNEVPGFDDLTNDLSYTESASPVISFITSAIQESDEPELKTSKPAIRVSALVSTYNAEAFIDGCLNNLVNQTLFKKGELEIIVVDACSPQDEKSWVERYQQYHDNIHYIRTPEREPLYASWNRAIRMAEGTYLTSANTDDRHRVDALEVMADYLDGHADIALVYPGQIDTDEPNETFETTLSKKVLNWPPYSYAELERHCIIGSQPMWRRILHNEYGLFREEFISAGDYEFWLRIGKHEMFYRYPETLGLYYRNPEGIEHGADTGKQETIRIWQEYGMFERGIPLILGGRLITEAHIPQFLPPETEPKLTFDQYIEQFEVAVHDSDFSEALSIAESTVVHFGELPYPHILQAIALRQLARHSEAILALENSIQIDETPEALVELIQLSRTTGNHDEAAKTEAYVRQKYPDWNKKLIQLAETESPEAVAERSKPALPDDLDYTITSFSVLKDNFEQMLRMDNTKHAEQLALAATRKFPDHHEAWVLQATSLRLKGHLDRARQAIEQSLRIQDSAEALAELLHVSLALGNEPEAGEIAAQMIKMYPEFEEQIRMALPPSISLPLDTTIAFSDTIKAFMPLQAMKIKQLRAMDYCLVSYPRSGNTWMRLLITHSLLLNRGETTAPGILPFPAKLVVPDLHRDPVSDTWTTQNGYGFRVFKSHDLAGVANQPILYLFRNPADALVSYYHFHKRQPELRHLALTSCDAFCLSKIEEYRAHLNTAIKVKECNPSKMHMLSYESLHLNPISALSEVMAFLQADVPESILVDAVDHCQFDAYQKSEKTRTDTPERFMRIGKPGTGHTELSYATLQTIESELLSLYEEALSLEGAMHMMQA